MTVGSGAFLHPAEKDQLKVNHAIRQILEGRTNNVFTATLSSSATSTVITNSLIGPNSTLIPVPSTANAASQMTLVFTSAVGQGTATVMHGSNSNTDQTFKFVVVG